MWTRSASPRGWRYLQILIAALTIAGSGAAQGNLHDATIGGVAAGRPLVGTTVRLQSGMPTAIDLWSPGGTLNGAPWFLAVDLQLEQQPANVIALPGEPGVVALTTDLIPLANTFGGGNGLLPPGLPSLGAQVVLPVPSSLTIGTLVFQGAVADVTAPNGLAVTPVTGGRLSGTPTLTSIFATTVVLAQYGYATHVEDLDGDGFPEIIGGARKDNGSAAAGGRTYVHDGRTGALLHVLDDPSGEADSEFGMSVSTGDLNGDGDLDIVVGARESDYLGTVDAGQVVVYFGPDFTTAFTIDPLVPELDGRFGHRTVCGDFDGDGFGDLAVASTGATVAGVPKAGRVDVFYGPSLAPGMVVDNPIPGDTDRFGYRFCVEDLDGDGFGEMIVAAPFKELAAPSGDQSGAIYVLSGPNYSLRNYFPNPTPSTLGLLGADVSCRDLDGDGNLDIIAGAELDDSGAVSQSGSVWLLFGPNFTTTLQVFAPTPTISGGFGSGCDAGDFDQDGFMDLMVGEFWYQGAAFRSGRAHVLFGPDWLTGITVEEPFGASNNQFGRRVRAADLDGDGDTEMIVGVPQTSASGGIRAGAIWIVEN